MILNSKWQTPLFDIGVSYLATIMKWLCVMLAALEFCAKFWEILHNAFADSVCHLTHPAEILPFVVFDVKLFACTICQP